MDLAPGKPVTMAGLRAGLTRVFPPGCVENLSETASLQQPMSPAGGKVFETIPSVARKTSATSPAPAYGSHLHNGCRRRAPDTDLHRALPATAGSR